MKAERPLGHHPLSPAEQVDQAKMIAHVAHAGQQDKAGRAYIAHPLAVASFTARAMSDAGCSAEEVAHGVGAAWLHDVIEDTPFEAADLLSLGIADEIVSTVLTLTHLDNEPRRQYYARIERDPVAVFVKETDIRHNSGYSRLKEVGPKDRARLAKKYIEARQHFGMEVPSYLTEMAEGD